MEIQVLCQYCVHSYAYYDDYGDLLADGCKFGRPSYSPLRPTVCKLYRDR